MHQLRIEYLPIGDLKPYEKNSRTHSKTQIAMLAGSMQEMGFTAPILTNGQGGILAGHGRWEAAKRIGMKEVPTISLGHLSPEQQRAYVVADNRLAETAGWDLALLQSEVASIMADGFGLETLGFTEDSFADLMKPLGDGDGGGDGNTDPDAVPPAPPVQVVRPGDIWVLGRHRLGCGDSTDATFVGKVLAGVKPNLMVTDPPYGVEYDASWRDDRMPGKKPRASGKVENDDRADWTAVWQLFPGEVAYVWHGMLAAGTVFQSLEAAGFKIRAEIVWAKSRHVMSRGHYHPQHESCFYAVKRTGKADWNGDAKQSTVWNIEHVKSETGHSTQKPVEAMQRPILNNSSEGQAVWEPFSGSGTTLIACERTGRVFLGQELNPEYVAVAVMRWQDFTGKQAVLEATGQTWAQVCEERINGAPEKPSAPDGDVRW